MVKPSPHSRPAPAPVPGVVRDTAPRGAALAEKPTLETVWAWLSAIPDPEIPAISLTDLGIIRDVDHGIENLDLKRQLSPPWTTDWMSDTGRAKLESYGIAPPRPAGGPQHCPHCKSTAVERISQFGSTPCKAQWRCTECREPFDYFKCI